MEVYDDLVKSLRTGYCDHKLLNEAADAIEGLIEENKELSSRIEECLMAATTPFMVTTSDEVKSLGPTGSTHSRASIDVNK